MGRDTSEVRSTASSTAPPIPRAHLCHEFQVRLVRSAPDRIACQVVIVAVVRGERGLKDGVGVARHGKPRAEFFGRPVSSPVPSGLSVYPF